MATGDWSQFFSPGYNGGYRLVSHFVAVASSYLRQLSSPVIFAKLGIQRVRVPPKDALELIAIIRTAVPHMEAYLTGRKWSDLLASRIPVPTAECGLAAVG